MSQTQRWLSRFGLIGLSIAVPTLVAPDRDVAKAQAAPQASAAAVPADLKPLLVGPISEMRLVVTRYNADRNTLIGDYARAGGGGGAPPRCRFRQRVSRASSVTTSIGRPRRPRS